MKGISHNEAVQELIEEYHASMPPALTQNETDMLLAALLMEMQAQRVSQGTPETVDVILEDRRRELGGSSATGTYRTQKVEAGNDWHEIDLSFTTSEVDVRKISGPVEIAFADKSDPGNVIPYDSGDSPLQGIQVATSNIWIRSATDGATETMYVEAWG